MDERTRELREEIEETRLRVGEEVEALSYKTDVGARLDDYVDEKKEALTSKVKGAGHAVTDAVSSVVPRGDGVKQQASVLKRTAEHNPLGLVIAGAAFGFIAGLLLPSTHVEDERLGEVADKVKDSASQTGHEAVSRGKEVVQSAVETAREEGTKQARELASDLEDRLQDATSDSGSSRVHQGVPTTP